MKIFFASNSRYGDIIIRKMVASGVCLDGIVTFPDKKQGRGQQPSPTLVKRFALEREIAVFEVSNKNEFDIIIEKESPDIVVVAGFGIIITSQTLERSFFVNAHPSLLPKYRGSSPIQSVLLSDDKITGTSIIEMREGVDCGPVIAQENFLLSDKLSYMELESALADQAGAMLAQVVINYNLKNSIMSTEQNHSDSSQTSKLNREEGAINWSESASSIEKKIRAYNPWPGAYTHLNGKRFKILEAEIQKQTGAGPFGEPGKTYLGTNSTVAVQTGEDFLLIKKMQVEGKPQVSSKEFLQGNINQIGGIFTS